MFSRSSRCLFYICCLHAKTQPHLCKKRSKMGIASSISDMSLLEKTFQKRLAELFHKETHLRSEINRVQIDRKKKMYRLQGELNAAKRGVTLHREVLLEQENRIREAQCIVDELSGAGSGEDLPDTWSPLSAPFNCLPPSNVVERFCCAKSVSAYHHLMLLLMGVTVRKGKETHKGEDRHR